MRIHADPDLDSSLKELRRRPILAASGYPPFGGINNVIFVKYCTGTSWLGTLHYVYVKTFQIR